MIFSMRTQWRLPSSVDRRAYSFSPISLVAYKKGGAIVDFSGGVPVLPHRPVGGYLVVGVALY